MLKRNKFVKKLNQERKLKLKTEQWLNGIVADAKRDDVIRLLKDKFDLEYDFPLIVAKYEWADSLKFQMDNQGVVNERWLKAEAGKIATKWFFGASPLPAHATWQSRNLFDRYVRIMASMPWRKSKSTLVLCESHHANLCRFTLWSFFHEETRRFQKGIPCFIQTLFGDHKCMY